MGTLAAQESHPWSGGLRTSAKFGGQLSHYISDLIVEEMLLTASLLESSAREHYGFGDFAGQILRCRFPCPDNSAYLVLLCWVALNHRDGDDAAWTLRELALVTAIARGSRIGR